MTERLARIGDLAEQIRGVSYAKEDASSSPRRGYLPVLRAGNITDHGLTFDDLVFVPEARISSKQKIKKNDVLIAASSGSIDVVGKAAQAANDCDAGFGAFCKVLRPNADVDPGYFGHFFKTQNYRRRVAALAAGININNLRNEHLDELEISLPPPAEQRRIAEVLDRAEALRAKRRAALAQLDTLTQAIFLDMFGDPRTNPKHLRKDSLGHLIKLKSGDFLPASQMTRTGSHSVFGGNGVAGFHDEYLFEEPQIVIGRVGAYCGCVHVSPAQSWITDNALYVSERDPALLFEYLAHALKLAQLNRYASKFGQPLISGSRLYPVQILVPTKVAQETFIDRANKVASLHGSYYRSAAQLDALLYSLQDRAFKGDLWECVAK